MIQTQVAMIHQDSGLNIASAVQRDTQEGSFTSGVIMVTTLAEDLKLGDVITPKQVFLKLIAGDPVKISFDNATWPLRMSEPMEAMVLSLDVESHGKERSTVTTTADVLNSTADDLSGRYFDIYDSLGLLRIWLNNQGASLAYGHITYLSPNDGDVVTVNGVSFTKAATGSATEFFDYDELVLLINSVSGVTATDDGGIGSDILVEATNPGAAGNNILMSFSGTGSMAVDARLAGGQNASVAPILPAGTGNRLLSVSYAANDTANVIATQIRNFINGAPTNATLAASTVGNVITINDLFTEARSPIGPGTSGFAVSRSFVVSSITTVWVKSNGSSQVAMAIAPF
jgi:hypothetical protein